MSEENRDQIDVSAQSLSGIFGRLTLIDRELIGIKESLNRIMWLAMIFGSINSAAAVPPIEEFVNAQLSAGVFREISAKPSVHSEVGGRIRK